MKDKCYSCNEDLSYSEKWDAYFCKHCNIWSENRCTDPICFFCQDRPERPVKNHYKEKIPNVTYEIRQ